MKWPTSLGSFIGLLAGWLVEGSPIAPSLEQVLLVLLAGGVGGIIAHLSGALAARADSRRKDLDSALGALKEIIAVLEGQNERAWNTVDALRARLEMCMGRIDRLPCQDDKDCPLGLAGDRKGAHGKR